MVNKQLNEIRFPGDQDNPEVVFQVEPFSAKIKGKLLKHNINQFYLTGQICAFGRERLVKYKNSSLSFQIIEQKKELSFLFSFEDNRICLVDIIDANNIFIADQYDFDNILKKRKAR